MIGAVDVGGGLRGIYGCGVLSEQGGEDPLDYEALMAARAAFKVVALNAETGGTVYFDKSDLRKDDCAILKASSSIPVVCRPYVIGGRPCYDGGIADPAPVKKALADGCDRAVLILTRPVTTVRTPRKDERFARVLARKDPRAAERLRMRYRTYNNSVAYARELEKAGRVLILAPDDVRGLETLTKDRKRIDALYRKGYADAEKIRAFIKEMR